MIALVRHAQYSSTSNTEDPVLSYGGKLYAFSLGQQLARMLPTDKQARIITSSAARAKETADIIAEELSISKVECMEQLWSDNKHSYNFEWLLDVIEDHFLDGLDQPLIIVSHLEYVQRFPHYWLESFTLNQSNYAQGVLIYRGPTNKLDQLRLIK